MDKSFLDLLTKAKSISVIDEGSIILFTDYINRCELQIQKNIEMMNRLAGKNDQLRLTSSMLSDVVRKYINLQESANLNKIKTEELFEELEERPLEVQEIEVEQSVKSKPKSKKLVENIDD